jgi:hypothetical protein
MQQAWSLIITSPWTGPDSFVPPRPLCTWQGFHILCLIHSIRLHSGRAVEPAVAAVLRQHKQDVQELLVLLPVQGMSEQLLNLRTKLGLDRLAADGDQDQVPDFDLPGTEAEQLATSLPVAAHFANPTEKEVLQASAARERAEQQAPTRGPERAGSWERHGLQLLQQELDDGTGQQEDSEAIRQHVTSRLQLASQEVERMLDAFSGEAGVGHDIGLPEPGFAANAAGGSSSTGSGSSQPPQVPSVGDRAKRGQQPAGTPGKQWQAPGMPSTASVQVGWLACWCWLGSAMDSALVPRD